MASFKRGYQVTKKRPRGEQWQTMEEPLDLTGLLTGHDGYFSAADPIQYACQRNFRIHS